MTEGGKEGKGWRIEDGVTKAPSHDILDSRISCTRHIS